MGLWLVIYLFEHLIVNSQAALWISDNGSHFVRLVNSLESLPFLHVIEVVFIGIPLLVHAYWGVRRSLSAKYNVSKTDGSAPALPYGRNRAYKWQRLTSWILLIGIIFHVVQMRFVEMPREIQGKFVVTLKPDEMIDQLADRLQVSLTKEGDQVIATAASPGKAMVLKVREIFQNGWMAAFYTLFVLAAAFHAFNGMWTALITWGAILSYRAQRAFIPLCWGGVAILAFLGLAAIWGSA